ncbi:MAG: DUF1460 domain-containing protein, partial [Pseudomonadota bacterium]|nr:DUF1460 domain-containing protein [Pseudomonadota bacterium]
MKVVGLISILFCNSVWADNNTNSDFTVLDRQHYEDTVHTSRAKIQDLLNTLHKYDNANARMGIISRELMDIPYIFSGAAGEGNWQPTSLLYQPGAAHIKQDPVYRLDGLNCQTFVQVAMALLYSNNINAFDRNILKISYGAAGNPNGEIVRYFNRNHFIDGDWNPVNQFNGFLVDVTAYGKLKPYTEIISADLTRQNWFSWQQHNLQGQVRVLNATDGPAMVDRFLTTYSTLNYSDFNFERVSLRYIPKEKIALLQPNGSYQPNLTLLNKIPTPSVVEIVRDPKKWLINGINIKDAMGSELSVSHLGILYRKNFRRGEVIYQKITCTYNAKNEKVCEVAPTLCTKKRCTE